MRGFTGPVRVFPAYAGSDALPKRVLERLQNHAWIRSALGPDRASVFPAYAGMIRPGSWSFSDAYVFPAYAGMIRRQPRFSRTDVRLKCSPPTRG